MGAVRSLQQSWGAAVCFFSGDGPALSILPLGLVYQYVRVAICQRASGDGPDAAGELSLEHSISGGRSRSVVQAGEVDLSFRSAAAAGDRAAGGTVEATVAGNPCLWRGCAASAPRLYLVLSEVYLLGGRLRLGRSLRFNFGGIGGVTRGAVVVAPSIRCEGIGLARDRKSVV